ncbi:class I SAM-dependent methyltransferase [Candidatus Entotheonella serta]|nr:class I SAM-dependent methyltransferase [Candidatus Entotheonella serta]
MSDLDDRIANLSPEKRELLKLLMAREQTSPSDTDPTSAVDDVRDMAPPDHTLVEAIRSSQYVSYTYVSAHEKKIQTRHVYNLVSRQLNASPFREHAFFLNLGYLPDHNPSYSQITLPEHLLNKNCIRLVLEVIGDCDIHHEVETLDVGCGRGGTISVLHRYFQPRKMTGLDLSSSAIAFCKRHHRYPNVHFLEGDSENLPFADASFDVVTNLESSQSYPNVTAFYGGVSRVLRTGGYFLYTDLFAVDRLESQLNQLQDYGLRLERRQDITTNVLLSCDEIGKTHFNVFAKGNDADFMGNFLGVPGSKLYNDN